MNKFYYFMCLSVICACISQVMLKKSALKSYTSIVKEYINPWVIGGYGLLFCSMLLTLYAYIGLDYKNGVIIESMGNILIPILSYFVFREKISIKKGLGIGFIVMGILVFYS